MTIHMNIGEAKSQLSKLVAAALRGEKVVLDRAGEPQVELVPVNSNALREQIAQKRATGFGSLRGEFPESAGEFLLEPAFTNKELDAFDIAPLGK